MLTEAETENDNNKNVIGNERWRNNYLQVLFKIVISN